MHPWAKMRKNVNLTQVNVAEQLGVERLSIIRYEQGLFGHLSDNIVETLSELYRVDPDLLVLEYRGYQRLQRLDFAATHEPWHRALYGYHGNAHPLIQYRTIYQLSRNQLCKGLCLDYGPISEYEMNRQRTVPEIIKIASEDMHWDYTGLEHKVLEWRASGRSSIK